MRLYEFYNTISENGFDDKAIWAELADQMTTQIDPSHPETQEWIQNYLRYYTRGSTVLVQDYDNTSIPEARFTNREYEQLGITKHELITWLQSQGISPMRKPKPYKIKHSMYD